MTSTNSIVSTAVSSLTSSTSTTAASTNTPEQLPLKGLKFHTLILFKDTDGKIIDMLTVDNDFSNERLKEYREKYQYGNVNPDGLSAPSNFFEWWKQLDVKQYLKNQMEKDYLMSLYTDDPSKSTTIKPSYYTLSVNTDKDVIDFMDFLNNLRTQMSTLYGVRYFGGALTPEQTALKTKIDEIKNDYKDKSTNYKQNEATWKKFIDLPVVTEIIGKAAIKELSKASKTAKYDAEAIYAIITEAATSANPLASASPTTVVPPSSTTTSPKPPQKPPQKPPRLSTSSNAPTTASATPPPKPPTKINKLKEQAINSLIDKLPTLFHQKP